jgi:hypothetical protein
LDSCRESAFEESGLETEADDRDYTTPTKIDDRVPEHLKGLGLKPSPVKDIYVMEPNAADEGVVAFQPSQDIPQFDEVLPRGLPNETTSVEVSKFDFCVCSF